MSPKLVVFGGTGRCGKAVIQRALELGTFDVVGFVRNEESAKQVLGHDACSSPNLKLVQATLDDAGTIQKELKDASYVCSALASFSKPHTQMSTAAGYVVQAAKDKAATARSEDNADSNEQKRLRYICYGVAGLRSDSKTWMQTILSYVSPYKFGPAMDDHQRYMKMLEENTNVIEYSVFGTPSMVENMPMRPYKGGSPDELNFMGSITNRIGTMDAADLILKRLQDHDNELPTYLDIIYE